MNTKNLIPGNTYRLYFKNGRSLVAEYSTYMKDRYVFVVCDSATITVCEWDFSV